MTCGKNWESQLHLSRHRTCWLIPDEYSCFMVVRLVCADEGIYSSDVKVVGIVLARCTDTYTESGSFDARAWENGHNWMDWYALHFFTFSSPTLSGQESPLKYTKIISIKSYHLIKVKGLRTLRDGNAGRDLQSWLSVNLYNCYILKTLTKWFWCLKV